MHALAALLAGRVEHLVGALSAEAEEVHARVEPSAPEIRVLDVAERDHAAEQQRELDVPVSGT